MENRFINDQELYNWLLIFFEIKKKQIACIFKA
jgi:hypothetical protein